MPVIMKGGTSGNRFDALFSPPAVAPQPVIDLAKSGNGSNVQWSQTTGNRQGPQVPPVPDSVHLYPTDMSTNCGPDHCQQDIVSGLPGMDANPRNIFRGAPDTGLS